MSLLTIRDSRLKSRQIGGFTLVELLTAKGFDIARRTVAKYREAMGIGSSVQRRRQKKMGR